METQPAHPPRPIKLENKTVQRILAAAFQCWSRDGYHGASLKEVAAQAGVAKSLLHYHFASKEHLLIELQSVYYRQLAQAVRERLERAGPSVAGALDALDQVWEGLLRTRDQLPFALEIWRAGMQNEAIKLRLDAFQSEILSLIQEGIVHALGPHARTLAIPPDRLAALLAVSFEGFWFRLHFTSDVAALRAVFDDFKRLIRGVLPPELEASVTPPAPPAPSRARRRERRKGATI